MQALCKLMVAGMLLSLLVAWNASVVLPCARVIARRIARPVYEDGAADENERALYEMRITS